MDSRTGDRLVLGFIGFLILALVGGFWFHFFGTKPRVVLALTSAKKAGTAASLSQRPMISEFLGPRSFVAVVDDTVHLFEKGKERWTAPLKPDAAILKRQQSALEERFARLQNLNAELTGRRKSLKAEGVHAFNVEVARYSGELRAAQEESRQVTAALSGRQVPDYSSGDYGSMDRWHAAEGKVFVEANAVWVVDDRSAIWFNRTTGARIRDVVFPGAAASVERVGSTFFAVCAGSGNKFVMRVSMEDGNSDLATVPGDSRLEIRRTGRAMNMPDLFRHRSEFKAVAGGLLEMDADLMQSKIIETKGMKPDTANPAATSTTGGGADGALEVAQTMANDARREATGGIARADGSRYTVTLQRLFSATPVPYWRAEMAGRPEVWPTETLIAVAAGQRLLVFDLATDKPRWEAKLTYPVREPARLGSRGFCMEHAGRLLVWDAGFLTAYKAADGKVEWRLPSVGISRVERDSDGMLYLISANLSPESLTYSLESNLIEELDATVLKVDPKDGRILWKGAKFIDCIASGGHLYATRHPKNPMDAANDLWNRSAPTERFMVYKLNRTSGKEAWSRFEPRRPSEIHADGRDLLMVFGDGVELLTSWSF